MLLLFGVSVEIAVPEEVTRLLADALVDDSALTGCDARVISPARWLLVQPCIARPNINVSMSRLIIQVCLLVDCQHFGQIEFCVHSRHGVSVQS